MNFDTFRGTMHRVANLDAALGEAIGYGCAPETAGYVYADNLFIEHDGTTACLTIGNQSWSVPGHLIGDLEAILYAWAVDEGIYAGDDESDRVGLTAGHEVVEWCRANGAGQAMSLALIRNALRKTAHGVCHLQDVCDVWAFIGECENDLEAYELARAVVMLNASRLYA